MSTGFRALFPSLLVIGGALAEDVPLIVSKNFKQQYSVGGILKFFRKDERIERKWLNIQPKSDAIVIKSIILNRGSCTFGGAAFPATLSSGQTLELVPDCDVIELETMTDKGAYKFSFDKSAD